MDPDGRLPQPVGAGRAGAAAGPETTTATAGPVASWTPAYLRARRLEGRLRPDEQVAALPRVPRSDPLRGEWLMRAESATRLLAYLARLPRPLSVIDVGCGNGWLANRIASIDESRVVGVDANELELAQARRVFGSRANLRFDLADIRDAPPPVDRPTVLVLASVVQYVRDLGPLIERLRSWLTATGELHILDSPFYPASAVDAARARTRRHYLELGVPEMSDVYQHHAWAALDPFEPEVLYHPRAFRVRARRLLPGGPSSPFAWIRIRSVATP